MSVSPLACIYGIAAECTCARGVARSPLKSRSFAVRQLTAPDEAEPYARMDGWFRGNRMSPQHKHHFAGTDRRPAQTEGHEMKRLILLRNAKASRDDLSIDDHARPLSEDGIWAAEVVAKHRAKRLHRVDAVLCSSSIRTRETLRLFEQHLPPSCKVFLDDALYDARGKTLRSAVRHVDDRFEVLLFVGHKPGLSELADTLCGKANKGKARKRLARGLKTSTLATIDLDIDSWSKACPGTGRLREVIRPKDLR